MKYVMPMDVAEILIQLGAVAVQAVKVLPYLVILFWLWMFMDALIKHKHQWALILFLSLIVDWFFNGFAMIVLLLYFFWERQK